MAATKSGTFAITWTDDLPALVDEVHRAAGRVVALAHATGRGDLLRPGGVLGGYLARVTSWLEAVKSGSLDVEALYEEAIAGLEEVPDLELGESMFEAMRGLVVTVTAAQRCLAFGDLATTTTYANDA